MTNTGLQIPERFRARVAGFPESSMGAHRIKIDLSDGRRIYEVYVAGNGDIAKIGDKPIETMEDLGFDPSDITEVISEI